MRFLTVVIIILAICVTPVGSPPQNWEILKDKENALMVEELGNEEHQSGSGANQVNVIIISLH